ncbi:MAG: sensor histidine kinase, partial [Betaproteobacteria bacterium]
GQGAHAFLSRFLALPRLRLPARWGYWTLLLLAMAGLMATATLSYRAVDKELSDAAMSRRVAVAQLAAATLSATFDRLADVTVSLATRVRFSELVSAGKWGDAIQILRAVPADFPFVERLFLADGDGTLMADVPELPEVRGSNFAHREWYKGVRRRGGQAYVSPIYKRAAPPQIDVFAVAAPITRPDGSLAGILVLQVRAERFLEWISGIDLGPEGAVYVTDSAGQIAFHSKLLGQIGNRDFSAAPIVQKLRRGQQGVEVAADPLSEEPSVFAYAPVARYGWGVVAQQSARSAFAARDEQLRRLSIGYFLVFVLCGALIYLASRIVAQRNRAKEELQAKAELERLVAERTAALEMANKELESFSYSVSHDLRSPLRAVSGFARMLEEDYVDKLDGEGRRLIKVIRDNSRKMGQLIDDLLAFSRMSRKPIAIAEIDMAEQARTTFAEVAAGDARIRSEIAPLPPARGDTALLKQVWVNLISNAVKFSATRDEPLVQVTGRAESAENVYCVRDNGVGFDMAYYDKLFGVFQRLHSVEDFPGTGVGLAIVQRIVSRHGGRVWAESKEGEGAAFYFALPQVITPEHISATPEDEAALIRDDA